MTADDRSALIARLVERLRADGHSGGGGWGYSSGNSGRIEPTCWALLALSSTWEPAWGSWAEFARPHIGFLASRQAADGLLSDTEPELFNLASDGLAAIVLTELAPLVHGTLVDRLFDGLVGVKGVRIRASDPKQDNALQGWPWIRDTFSWVEPTSWCLLALKKAGPARRTRAAVARIEEAEKLLLNRVCSGGGWNYGNASALGQDLRAYVPTTALALLAMRNRRSEPAVAQSLEFLAKQRLSEQGAVTLALTTMKIGRAHV